jgi:ArsR family transcriptional regulator
MDSKAAVQALSALAQASRLEVYRLLVQVGPDGMAASEIAERLRIPANTLSFHLKTLSHAELVCARQEGRFIFYSTNYEHMNTVLEFLTKNCCGGRGCMPVAVARRKRKTRPPGEVS